MSNYYTINPTGINRWLMPQIKRKDRDGLVDRLALEIKEFGSFKPSQRQVSEDKVQWLLDNPAEIGSIIVSADGFILDGHHNYEAARRIGAKPLVLQSYFNFDSLYLEAHKVVSKLGVKKSTESLSSSIARVEQDYNSIYELFAQYVQEEEATVAAPMVAIIAEKLEALTRRVELINLRAAVTVSKIKDSIGATELELNDLDMQVKENRLKAGKMSAKIEFLQKLSSKIQDINERQESIANRLIEGFVNGTIDVSADALDGSIFMFANPNDADVQAAVDVLAEFTTEPRLLLDRIADQIDNLNGFDPGKINCDMDALSEAYDISYPASYHIALRKTEEAREEALRLSQQVMMSNISSAGKCWISKSILELVGDHGFAIKESFEADSVVKGNGGDCMSSPLKEAENDKMSSAGKKFLASACGETMNMPILLSAGGGMQFLNPVFPRVMSYVTDKLVDIKAYIASANSSAARKTIETDAYVGTQVHELYENGSPLIVNGKIVAIRSAAEGSHWFPRNWGYSHKLQNQHHQVAVQIRGLSQDFITEVMQPAAKSHEEVTANFSDWLGSSKSNFLLLGQNIFRNHFLLGKIAVLDKIIPHRGAQPKDRSILIVSTKEELEARAPGKQSYSPTSNAARQQGGFTKANPGDWLNASECLAKGETVTFPFDPWTFAGNLTQEEFRALQTQEDKKAYLDMLTLKTFRKLVPSQYRSLETEINMRWISSKDKDSGKVHLCFVLESSRGNMNNLSYFLAMVTKRQLENEALLETYPYWDTFEAESYGDFMNKVESGYMFKPAFMAALTELKDMIPSLIKTANGARRYLKLTHIAQRKGQPLHSWSIKHFATCSYGERGSSITDAKRKSDQHIVVPCYDRKTLWGWKCENYSIFVKGIAVDHVSDHSPFCHLDGSVADEILVVSGFDGVKCKHKNLVLNKTEEILSQKYYLVDYNDPEFGVAARGFDNFKTKSLVLSKEKEKISLGITRVFKTSKVVVTSQFLEKLPTDLHRADGDSSVIHATEESSDQFIDYLSPSWDWMQRIFETLRKIPTGPVDTSDYFSPIKEVDDRLSPSKLFKNLMCVNSRHIQGPTFWKDIEDSVAAGKNANAVEVMTRCSTVTNLVASEVIVNSMAYQTAVTEMVNSRLQEACKGSSVKGKYFVVKNFELLPDRVMVVHKKYRTKKGQLEGAAWRFPIATPTSLMNVEVVFSDDKRFLKTLMEAGICDHNGNMADVILMNSACKVWFQQDDDGDQFGLIIDPKDPTEQDFAILEWHILKAKDNYGSEDWYNMIHVAKKLYKKLEAKIVIALTKLRRQDLPNVDIEMETIPGGKALFKFLEANGVCTKHFKELAAEDLRGPVGLVSDLMSVVLASGKCGDDLRRLAACLGYLLQHSIDSAKKNKLMIPPAVLMHDLFWVLFNGRFEINPDGNDAVMAWNEAWRNLDLDLIKKLEAQYLFLPNHSKILESLYHDQKYLYYAPCTLLTHLQKKAKLGAYETIELFGKEYPVPASAFYCIDETRYVSQHVFNIVDIEDKSGKKCGWNQMARFRSIRIEDYLALVRRPIDEEGKNWKLFWPEVTDGDNYVGYWTRQDSDNPGFAGVLTHSIPNYIFKEQLRFSMEMVFGGKQKLLETAKAWNTVDGHSTGFKTKLQHSYSGGNAFFANALIDGGPRVSKFLTEGAAPWWTKTLGRAKLNKAASVFCTNLIGLRSTKKKIVLDANFLSAMDPLGEYSCFASQDGLNFEEVYESLIDPIDSSKEANPRLANKMLDDLRQVLWAFVVHQLSANPWVGDGDIYAPNMVQQMFCSSINKVFKKDITKKGRESERVYRIPKREATKDNPSRWSFQRKPDGNWFKGDWSVWKSFAMGCANDIVIKALAKLPLWNACGFTCTIDLERDGCVVETKVGDHVVKSIDENKLNQVISNYGIAHLNLAADGEEPVMITDCPCCMKELRKQVSEIQRSSSKVPGTKAYNDRKVAFAAVKTSITCLESVKYQASCLVDKITESNSPLQALSTACEESDFGLAPETIRLYVAAYGTDEQKCAFGFATSDAEVAYSNWQSSLSAFGDKAFDFLREVEQVNSCRWWTLPLEYLGSVAESFLVKGIDPVPYCQPSSSSYSETILAEIKRAKEKLEKAGIQAEIVVAETEKEAWMKVDTASKKIVHINPNGSQTKLRSR